jgi:hypothetical protein
MRPITSIKEIPMKKIASALVNHVSYNLAYVVGYSFGFGKSLTKK